IIVTDESPSRLLLARRSNSLRFMGGFHVFPGGRIDESEPIERVRNAPDEEEAAAIHAVAREIFEETCLLIVSGDCPDADTTRAARRAILDGHVTFDAFLEQHGLFVDASRFEPAGVWVTPIIAPIRFDTRYFLCRVLNAEGAEACGGEIDAVNWYTPADARKAWRAGRIQVPPPVAYVLQNLEAYAFPEVWDHLRSSGDHTGHRPAKMEFANGMYVLPLRSPTLPPATHTNCVIVGDRELYLIDPATHDEEELGLLTRQVDMLIKLGGSVKAVLLTHSHIDHVCAAEFCRATFDAPIWTHEASARQLPFSADRHLVDNEIIHVPGEPDWRLRCIHTPGHDPGHLCFLEETTRTLIAGDMIANPGTIIVSLDLGGDMAHFLNSLERLAGEDFDSILPAHGMPLMKGPEKIRKHLEHRLWREGKLKLALANGTSDIAELLAKVYDDVPPATWPLAEMSLRAHLAKLGVHT
ncbi:MAG: MBL fold metallo-hydrolase, partial [Candidatus Hydrogenedentes bacterium]|nr:MBL fold metallo-hydrolase [Candidatus Hydrogenedentota bacterium]